MKFSTILYLIILIIIVVTNSATSQNAVFVQTTPNGVHISVRGLQATLKPVHQSAGTSVWITNSRYAVSAIKGNEPTIQKLRISIAIPPFSEITPQLHNYRTRKVATTTVVRASEMKESSTNAPLTIFYPSFELKPSVTFNKIGIQRGVEIADIEIQPFQYSTVTGELLILDSAEIEIPFGKSIPPNSEELAAAERGLFSSVVNASQIPAIRRMNSPQKVKAISLLSSIDSVNTWYNPQATYLRIATTTDGVTYLKAKTIIDAVPEWNELSTSGLHLLFKGKELPFGTIDNNGKIDPTDEYFFAGRRAIGDSTWQNCITPEAVFYLYYDASIVGKRFEKFEDVNQSAKEIQSVSIHTHIEEDRSHFWGDSDPKAERLTQYKSDVLLNEGFYWVNLNNSIFEYNKTFNYPLLVAPSDQKGDMLETNVYFHTTTKNFTSTPNYSVISSLNSSEQSKINIDGITNGNIGFSVESSKFLGGINKLTFKSDTVANDNLGRARTADLLVNYLTLSGKVKPFASGGKSDFRIDDVTQPSRVNIRGFRSSQVVVIDTVQSLFTLKEGASGTTVRTGGVGGQTPRISIVINDSVVVSVDSSALYVVITEAPSFSIFRVKRFDQAGGGIRSFIDAAPTGSIIISVSNLPSIAQEIKQVFGALGSQDINQLSAGSTWCGVFQKGNISVTKEKSGVISSLAEFIPHIGGKAYQIDLALSAGKSYSLQSADVQSAETPSVSREQSSNLHDTTQRFDAVIITHSKFKEGAERLAKHRASQGWKITVVTVEDIYKEFYGGEKSPHAIKSFLKYCYSHWQKPSPAYLILFGDASWDPRKFEYNSIETDYVPSYGYPVSDYWFTLLDGNDLIPEMAVGRLPVRSVAEANDMVDKLIEYDTLPSAPWKKKFLFLSGGGGSEGAKFYNKFLDVADFILYNPICGDTTRIRGDLGVEFAKPTTIRAAINDGALWLSFFGHSAPTIFDLDGWAVEDLNNRGRYNVLATYSCNSGAYGNPYGIARNESYVITPHKGSIAAFGSTFIGYVDDDAIMQYTFHKNMADDTVRLLGDILNKAKRGWESLEELVMQYSLIGDPLTRMTLDNKPDIYSMKQEVIITSSTDEPFITEIDSVTHASFTIRNAGLGNRQEIPLLLIHRYSGGIDSSRMTLGELCNHETVNTVLVVKNRPGTHTVSIIIDPESIVDELKRNNNITTITFEVFSAGLASLDPLPYWDVDAQKPAFRFVEPQKIIQAEYEFILQTSHGDTIAHFTTDKPSQELTIHEVYVEWLPNVKLLNGKSYRISGRVKNLATDKISKWLHVPFHAVASQNEYTANWKQQSNSEILDNSLHDIIAKQNSDSTYQLQLNTYSIPISVVANNGKPYAKIKVGESEPISFNIYTRFNLVHLTPRDTSYIYKDYETFYQTGRSGTAEDVVRYLRDSVAWGDIIILAPGGAAFNSFFFFYQPDSIGSMKSFAEILKKQYGASLIDSIYLRTHYPDGNPIDSIYYTATGYALIARKDSLPHPIKEVYGFWQDTVSIQDTLQFYSYSGEVSSPVIGPSAAWDSLKIISDIPPLSTMNIKVYGKTNSSATEQLLKTNSLSNAFSLHDIDVKQYPYLLFKTSLMRSAYSAEPLISGFECIYKPTIEYAILPSKTFISANDVLRGDTAVFNLALMNIAKRGLPDSSEISTIVQPEIGSGRTFTYYHPLPKLLSEELIEFTDTIPSKEIASTSRIQPVIDGQNKIHEIYRFNNKSALFFNVREDTTKPHIEFRVDGVLVKNNDFVAPEPLFEIFIRDNSTLAIDSAKIRIRLNRFIQPDTTSINAMFTPLHGKGDRRALLSFITKRLEEENIIQITVEDASNNKDTLKIQLNVAKNAVIENLLTIPTPTDQGTSISFTYIGQNQDSPATVDIFSLSGQAVRTLPSAVRIGANSIFWDGNDSYGNRVAPGIYVYRLNVQAQLYSDPVFGKIMITR